MSNFSSEVMEITVSQLKNQLNHLLTSENTKNKAILIEGPTGVGKTAITRQIAVENGWKIIDVRLAGMLPEDIRGIPYTETWSDKRAMKEMGVYDQSRPSIKYILTSQLAKAFEENVDGIIDFEEINRAHPDSIQAIFQLVGDRCMDDKVLGDKWRIVGSINPDDSGDYQVNNLDIAFKRRWKVFRIKYDLSAFLKYAKEKKMHKVVIDFLTENADKLSNNDPQFLINPAVWENVSDELYSYNQDTISLAAVSLQSTLGKSIGYEIDQRLKNTLKKAEVTPFDVLEYTEETREKVLKMVEKGRINHLNNLAIGVSALINQDRKLTNNVISFLNDIPNDIALGCVKSLEKIELEEETEELFNQFLIKVND